MYDRELHHYQRPSLRTARPDAGPFAFRELPNTPSDAGREAIEQHITILTNYPSNITGHFCDLVIGMHATHGKVALKRPRIAQHGYSRRDVRVSYPLMSATGPI